MSSTFFTDRDLGNTFPVIILVGKASTRELAQNFVTTIERIEAFLEGRSPPFIAKVYRPSPEELLRHASAAGRVEDWYP